MQKVTIICVGKLKEAFYKEAVIEYSKRLQRHCILDIIEIPETKLNDNPSSAEISRALDEEASRIREKIPKGSSLIAMCIEGKLLSSESLSEKMMTFGLSGHSNLAFLIGGSFGLSPTLKNESIIKLSMSPMTFPHHLARVMLLEQIYRAYQIIEGTKYHK